MKPARRWQVPAKNGGVLVDPPFSEVPRLLEENRKRLAADCLIFGRPLRERRENFEGMWRGNWKTAPVVMCGHQPELFHPGVWVKDFAVCGLARRHNLNPLRLEIDTDTIKTTSLRLPFWNRDPEKVRIFELPFDQWTGETPYETRSVVDQNLFISVPHRATNVFGNWGSSPILPEFWDEIAQALASVSRNSNLPLHIGTYFSIGRLFFEQRWGCANFQSPLSLILRRPSGDAFIAHILDDLPRFHSIYNDCLRAYRREHGLRSHSHPVPDLAADGGSLEAPFWLFNANTSKRGRLLVRQRGDLLDLNTRRDGAPITVPRRREDTLSDLAKQNLFIQTRALTTTMFARLFLCDLFIHGIGGGIYDELTDEIIRRYFGIEPPSYMVVSGTLRLPLPTFPATVEQCRQLQRELRDLRWNPQRYLEGSALAALRDRWRTSAPTDSVGRRERFRALQTITAQMRDQIPAAECERRQQRLERCRQELAANEILRRRDYAFCLYPEELLRPFCIRFLNLD